MSAAVELLLHRRWLVFSGVVALVLLLGAGAARLEVRNDLAVWFVDDDPALTSYQEFLAEFGSDEVVVLAVPLDKPVLSAEGLSELARLSDEVARVSGLERTMSLPLLPAAAGEDAALGRVVVGEVGPDDVARARATLEALPKGERFVGKDGTTAVVYAWVAQTPDVDAKRAKIIDDLRAAARIAIPERGGDLRLAGGGVIYDAINRRTETEGAAFIGIAYLIVILALLAVTRRAVWTAAAVAAVSLTNTALFGFMGFMGITVNAVTMTLPTLSMILGVAHVIHLSLAVERATPENLAALLKGALVPCAFNALTTAGAFLSLMGATMGVTREFGAAAGFGAFMSYVAGSALVLALAPWMVQRRGAHAGHSGRAPLVGNVVAGAVKRRAMVATTFGVLLVAAVGAGSTVEVDTRTIDFLPKSDRVQADHLAIEADIGPYIPLELRVKPEGDWRRPEVLAALLTAEREMAKDPRVAATWSVADLLRAVQASLDSSAVFPPATASEVERLVGFAELVDEDRVLPALVSKDAALRLTVSVPLASAKTMVQTAQELVERASFDSTYAVSGTGYLPLYGQMVKSLVRDQVSSFVIAFVVVFGLIGLLLRDRRLLLASILPNLFPIAAVAATMALLGITLDVATVTIAAAILGIIVDDSVHNLMALKERLAVGASAEAAARDTGETTGLAVVSTSVVFTLGFLVLSAAGLKTVSHIGILSAVGVLAALVADLLLLPALVALLTPREVSR